MILLVDNYDSFTYNLLHLFHGVEVEILRNDDPKLEEVAGRADGIVFSPGPGRPSEAGQMEKIIRDFYQTKPLLGICLGHQAIAEVFGGTVSAAQKVMHGKQSTVHFAPRGLFKNLTSPIEVMRYHSLLVENLPPELVVTAQTADAIMAVEHRDYPIYGLQFHPESIGTPEGQKIIDAFIAKVGEKR